MQTPRNIHYEPKKRRYTVRLWYRNMVIYRSHHPDLDTAAHALEDAREKTEYYRQKLVTMLSQRKQKALPNSITDLI